MRLLGFYVELGDGNNSSYSASIFDAVRSSPGSTELAVLDYLKNGIPLIDMMEATPDVISRDNYIPGGSSILTDGSWVWREDLAYYVARYHLQLDNAFLDHLAENLYGRPTLSSEAINGVIEAISETLLN